MSLQIFAIRLCMLDLKTYVHFCERTSDANAGPRNRSLYVHLPAYTSGKPAA